MELHQLLQDELNRDIVSLLVVSNLAPKAKRAWIFLLPHMTNDEKSRLRAMLEEEVSYEIKVSEEAANNFLAEIEKVGAADRQESDL